MERSLNDRRSEQSMNEEEEPGEEEEEEEEEEEVFLCVLCNGHSARVKSSIIH